MNQANRPCFLLFQYAQKRKAASAQPMLALCQAFAMTNGLPTKTEDILVKRAAECVNHLKRLLDQVDIDKY